MFDHLDDPSAGDEPLVDVGTVRKRGRTLIRRRRLVNAGAVAAMFAVVLGVASISGIGPDTDNTVVATPGDQDDDITPDATTSTFIAEPTDAPTDATLVVDPDDATPEDPGDGNTGPVVVPPAEPTEPDGADGPGNPGETPGGGDELLTLVVAKDSYLSSSSNRNVGASARLFVRNDVPALLAFDASGINPGAVTRATLRLSVCRSASCPEGTNNWPVDGSGRLTIQRANDGYELWAHGSGTETERGSGAGVTRNCVADSDISDEQKDCAGDNWSAGAFGPERSGPGMTNNMSDGATIEIDVTADVRAGFGALDRTYMTFFVRQLGAGAVDLYSREGAQAAGTPALAAQLVITQST